MKIITQLIPKNSNIILFGDDHWGSPFRSDDAHKQLKIVINSKYEGYKNNFLLHHGDIIEAILPDDPRASKESIQSPFVLRQMQDAADYYRPLANKIIAILDGNHPRKLWRFGDLTKAICNDIGVTFGTWSSIVNYIDKDNGKIYFRHYATHGSRIFKSSADDILRREANIKLSIKRSCKDKIHDCFVMSCGHSHTLHVVEPIKRLVLTTENNSLLHQHYTDQYDWSNLPIIPEDQRYYVNTGSSMRLYIANSDYTNYAEVAGYDPIELGFAVMVIRDGKVKGIRKEIFQV